MPGVVCGSSTAFFCPRAGRFHPYNWSAFTVKAVSASPELLVRLEAGRVETRPIAGTYPRRARHSNDNWLRQALVTDAKERAEHIMLVDLERNDLGRVCLPSTVRLSEALTQELYS